MLSTFINSPNDMSNAYQACSLHGQPVASEVIITPLPPVSEIQISAIPTKRTSQEDVRTNSCCPYIISPKMETYSGRRQSYEM
jgi:hypothetical protein